MAKKTKRKPKPKPDPTVNKAPTVGEIILELERRVATLEAHMTSAEIALRTLRAIAPRDAPPPTPTQQQGYLAGQWHRRDGTVYARVAARGTPNADNTTGSVPPSVEC